MDSAERTPDPGKRRWPSRSLPSRPLPSRPLRSGSSSARRRPVAWRSRPLGGKRAPVGQVNLLVPASPAQREKVAGACCIVCGRSPVDAAHIVPQQLGGCADPACAIPLCRVDHKRYDGKTLVLAPYLAEGFEAELEHALTHVSAEALDRALRGGGWGLPRWRRKR